MVLHRPFCEPRTFMKVDASAMAYPTPEALGPTSTASYTQDPGAEGVCVSYGWQRFGASQGLLCF